MSTSVLADAMRSGSVVPQYTLPVAASLVVQTIEAVVLPTPEAPNPLIVGAVVSTAGSEDVVNDVSLDVAVLFEASADSTLK